MSLRLVLVAFISSTVLFNRRSIALVSADIVISEIAGKGSSNVCGEEDPNDWIELHNTATNASVSLAGYILHDDNGIDDATAFTFPPDYQALEPGEYRLLCTKGDDVTTSPQFAIGGDDTISLVASDRSTVVASVGPLPDTRNEFDITYAWDLARGGNA
jgi:Lamin Tail Domain